MLEWSLDNLPTLPEVKGRRLDQLRYGLRDLYKQVCAYHHAPQPKQSVVTLGGGLGQETVYPFMLAMTLWMVVLREIVHLYVITYPMILFPVPIHERFGFTGPLGIFSDSTTSAIVKRFLSPEAEETLRGQLAESSLVRERLDYFLGHPQLSAEELESSWEAHRTSLRAKVDVDGLPDRIAYSKSFTRAMGWLTNYLHLPEMNEDVSDEAVDRALEALRSWG